MLNNNICGVPKNVGFFLFYLQHLRKISYFEAQRDGVISVRMVSQVTHVLE